MAMTVWAPSLASQSLPQVGARHGPPAYASLSVVLGGLQMRAAHYFHKGLADNTHRIYNSAQRQYLTFCETHDFTAVPASEETLSLFVAFLADRLKPQSIKVYLAGIRALHISHRFHNPLTHTIKLQQTLRGIEHVHSSPPKQKLPITSVSPTTFHRPTIQRQYSLLGGRDHRPLSAPICRRIYCHKQNFLWCQDLTPPTRCQPLHYANWWWICSSTPTKIEDWSTTPWSGPIYCPCSPHCLCSLRLKDQSTPSTCSSPFHPQWPIVPTFLWTPISPQRSHHFLLNTAPTHGSRPSTLQRTQFSHWWCNFSYHCWTEQLWDQTVGSLVLRLL